MKWIVAIIQTTRTTLRRILQLTLHNIRPPRKSAEERTIQGAHMIYVKVQYDAYNRTFKLIDRDAALLLEDYVVYDLAIPLILEEDEGSFTSIETMMAQARHVKN